MAYSLLQGLKIPQDDVERAERDGRSLSDPGSVDGAERVKAAMALFEKVRKRKRAAEEGGAVGAPAAKKVSQQAAAIAGPKGGERTKQAAALEARLVKAVAAQSGVCELQEELAALRKQVGEIAASLARGGGSGGGSAAGAAACVFCQICSGEGHTALQCSAYKPSYPAAAAATPAGRGAAAAAAVPPLPTAGGGAGAGVAWSALAVPAITAVLD